MNITLFSLVRRVYAAILLLPLLAAPPSVLRGARPATQVPMPSRVPFSLLATTRPSRPWGILTPPPGVAPAGPHCEPVTGGMGTGLWIGIPGGVGYRTLTWPQEGALHLYHFGTATLVLDGARSAKRPVSWVGPDGATRPQEGDIPYQETIAWTSPPGGPPSPRSVTLVPIQLSRTFRITAQPLGARGLPLGPPVGLVCQPVNPTVLFAMAPSGYSTAMRELRVTIARVGRPGERASWLVGCPPTSVRNLADAGSPVVTAGFGPVALHAAAAVADDYCGYPGFWTRLPPRDAGGGWSLSEPSNWDGHAWTGVPTVRVVLAARNTSHDFGSQNWVVRIDRIMPEWGVPIANTGGHPFDVFPVYNPQNMLPGSDEVAHDYEVGAAYPGQQHWVEVTGEALRSAYRTETVTFHDAEVVHDAAFGGDRIVWPRAETETTPDGIAVTALNGRPGTSDMAAPPPGGNAPWTFDHGNAELLLAWHLPGDFSSLAHPSFTSLHDAGAPQALGDLRSECDYSAPDWAALTAPGGGDAGALAQGGWMPLRLTLSSSAMTVPARPAQGQFGGLDGLVQMEPMPLPRHLGALTFRIMVREQQESHLFRFRVPVGKSFPAGWDPDAADGRFR